MSEETQNKLELSLPNDLNDQWGEIYLTIKDYIFYGASYQTTLELLQEIGLSYNRAVMLLADVDTQTTE